MRYIKNVTRNIVSAAFLSASTLVSAAPVVATNFNLSATSFIVDSGYGLGPLLDARFTPAKAPGAFSLSMSAPTYTFKFGDIGFYEVCVNAPKFNCPGAGNETLNLNVTALFSFSSPSVQTVGNFAVTGAFGGPSNDAAIDYFINFAPVKVVFGNGGIFMLDLDDLRFTNSSPRNKQNLLATITLVRPSNNVPEPGSLALLGLGLAAVAVARRRSK